MGIDCSIVDNAQMMPFGEPTYDYRIGPDQLPFYLLDDGYYQITMPQSFTVGCRRSRTLYININGFVTFFSPFISWTPQYFPFGYFDLAMLAAFWSDIDLRGFPGTNPGKLWYHCYTRGDALNVHQQSIFDRTSQEVRDYYNDYSFQPTMVCVITWQDIQPYPSFYNVRERACFQMTLTSDSRTWRSYAIYAYHSFKNWWYYRPNLIGVQRADFWISNLNYISYYPSSLSWQCGRRGAPGRWHFLLSAPECESSYWTPYSQCYNWYYQQQALIWFSPWYYYSYYWYAPPCPCFMWQAWWDPRYIVDWGSYCAYSSFSFYTYGQQCCYTYWGNLITWPSYYAGSFLYYHPYYYGYGYYYSDYYAKQWCCLYSNLCWLYYQIRPLNTCWGYRFPWWAFFWCDPHITTPDSTSYTFNGRGEYWMMYNPQAFYLQGRTDLAWDSNGLPVQTATVFVAIAAKHLGPSGAPGDVQAPAATLYVTMDDTRTKLLIHVDSADQTAWYDAAADGDRLNFNSLTISKSNNTLRAFFPSGIGIIASVQGEQLQSNVQVPSGNVVNGSFAGLLGTVNGNAADDFLCRDGTQLSTSASEEEIFHKFGQPWALQTGESILYYPPGTTPESFQHPEFVPTFGIPSDTPLSVLQAADALCTVNGVVDQNCKQDYVLSGGNTKLATASRDGNKAYNDILTELRKNLIYLNFSSDAVRWTVGVKNNVTVIATDSNSADTASLELTTNFTGTGHQVDPVGPGRWTFAWTPQSATEIVYLSFFAKDSTGAISPTREVKINLCDCMGDHGKCNWDLPLSGFNESDLYTAVSCICRVGFYEGDHCEKDFNWCTMNVCGDDANCTDLTAEEHLALLAQVGADTVSGVKCNDIIKGFERNETAFMDIDECVMTPNPCPGNQACVNTIGSYNCSSCADGYSLDETGNCTDSDECLLLTSGCGQICSNTVGGYQCSCASGYTLSSTDGKTCSPIGADPCIIPCTNGYCEGGLCKCSLGFKLTGTTCSDIDECSSGGSNCSKSVAGVSESVCINAVGSYTCNCTIGSLAFDQRTCKQCPPRTWGPECQPCVCFDASCNMRTGACDEGCPTPSLMGPKCDQHVNQCSNSASNPCSARTKTKCVDRGVGYECKCDDWYLPLLEDCLVADACLYNLTDDGYLTEANVSKCGSNGFCVNGTNPGEFTCQCVRGYTGQKCETDIDECIDNKCKNGATCVDQIGGFTCNCTQGFFGVLCDVARAEIDSTILSTVITSQTTRFQATSSATASSRGATTTVTPLAVSASGSGTIKTASAAPISSVTLPATQLQTTLRVSPSSSGAAATFSTGSPSDNGDTSATSISSTDTTTKSGVLSTGSIVGIAVGGSAIALALVGLLACFCLRGAAGARPSPQIFPNNAQVYPGYRMPAMQQRLWQPSYPQLLRPQAVPQRSPQYIVPQRNQMFQSPMRPSYASRIVLNRPM